MSTTRPINNVAIYGAAGQIGSYMTSALLSSPNKPGTITAVTRDSSSSVFPAGVTVRKANIESQESIAAALVGVDAFIITLPFSAAPDLQPRLIAAAADAGVKYVLPNEFGSDTNHPAVSEVPVNGVKREAREAVEKHGLKWIGIVTNPWYEFSLEHGAFGPDLKTKTATLWDDGTVKTHVSGMANVGAAVAALLALPETSATGPSLSKYANKWLYTSNLYVSQNDILASAQRVTGTTPADWTVNYTPGDAALQTAKEKTLAGDFSGLLGWIYGNMFTLGRGGQYEGREVANEPLGLQPGNIDALTKIVVDRMKAKGEL